VAAVGLAVILETAGGPSSASAQELPPPPPPQTSAKPKPSWDLKLGLSYLATSGNTDNSSAGFDTSYRRTWGLWSLDASAAAVRATRNDVETAENASTQLRGRRKIVDGLEATAGLRSETNRFAGVDLRTVADTSLSWSAIETPGWRLRTLWGMSWTREEPRGELPVRSSLGGLLQIQNTIKISEGSELNGQVTAYPDLEEAEDYRLNANLALQAALNRHLALRLGYDVKYDNEPIRGFERTDSTSTASLVLQLGQGMRR
jgi:putative salt-induced outer membrane protein